MTCAFSRLHSTVAPLPKLCIQGRSTVSPRRAVNVVFLSLFGYDGSFDPKLQIKYLNMIIVRNFSN